MILPLNTYVHIVFLSKSDDYLDLFNRNLKVSLKPRFRYSFEFVRAGRESTFCNRKTDIKCGY